MSTNQTNPTTENQTSTSCTRTVQTASASISTRKGPCMTSLGDPRPNSESCTGTCPPRRRSLIFVQIPCRPFPRDRGIPSSFRRGGSLCLWPGLVIWPGRWIFSQRRARFGNDLLPWRLVTRVSVNGVPMERSSSLQPRVHDSVSTMASEYGG